MNWFVEIRTLRASGEVVVERSPATSQVNAYHAVLYAQKFFNRTESFTYSNDFGERVHITVAAYGGRAQVSSGVFVL